MRVWEPHTPIFPSSPPCLPAHSVQPEGAGAVRPQRGSRGQSRGCSWAEPGPEHCRQKEKNSLPGRPLEATHLFEDRQTLHSERDMLRFTSYRLGPHDPELKDPKKSFCLPLTS